IMFLIGALPALLAFTAMRRLKEPEKWREMAHAGGVRKPGSYGELFKHPTWRKHATLGLLLASSGVIGLWGIGFFSADLSRAVFRAEVAPVVYDRMISEAKATGAEHDVADLLQ